ncbi:hypothetical protein Pcinc_002253 [Petrolisthes cinctipes]|uniref:Uncharacterized protein n=1 Tax=Petrolisthes cinctipes TaxID=88211 RepID=A0AAE1GLC9_PETCI|nr:hypothetical protein Pcinc_002253 [Petrolisthes cinctipes]
MNVKGGCKQKTQGQPKTASKHSLIPLSSFPDLLTSNTYSYYTMSRIPNPFVHGNSQGQPQRNPDSCSMPGFLLMTRPPGGSNSYSGGGGRHSFTNHGGRDPAGDFICFSPSSMNSNVSESSMRRGSGGGGGGRGLGGRSSRGGGGRDGGHMRHQQQGFQGSPRFPYPYQQQSPSPHRHPHSYSHTPRGRYNYGQTVDNFNSYNNNNSGNSRRGKGHMGPISDIPIDKFISPSMVQDPWVNFDLCDNDMMCVSEAVVSGSSAVVVTSLDDSEIVIDSDASVIVESSYEDGGVSGMEGDSPPAPDPGSESPYVATSSTSEKDTTGSDTASDG